MRQENYSNFAQYHFKTSFEESLKLVEDNISILINKKSTNEGSINHVVFTTDLSNDSHKIYLQLLEICTTNNYVINFLYLNTSSQTRLFTIDFKTELNRFTNICPPKNCGIIWETPTNKVAKGIEDVVGQFGGELIVVPSYNGKKFNLHKEYLSDFVFVNSELC